MSLEEGEDGFVSWTLDPKIFAFLTAFVNNDIEAMHCFREEPINWVELVLSVMMLWKFAVEAGEKLGGPSVNEVLRGIGLGLARLEDDN